MKKLFKVHLSPQQMPDKYLNLSYYLNKYLNKLPDSPLHPITKKPINSQDLSAMFPQELIRQETSLEEYIEIPNEIQKIYQTYRPSPLVRARSLEIELGTPAHIYYKYEGVSPAGSHKLNTAVAQAYYNKIEGVKTLVTETGAGQWGTALSMACSFFDLKCKVFMVRVSFDQKPYRRTLMQIFGADVLSSPSAETDFGRQMLKRDPDTSGSLGIAISEALETIKGEENAKYSLGSVLNHVLLHQTIIGQEAQKQFDIFGEEPDILIGCCGGGSNFAGFTFPFLANELAGKSKNNIKYIGVEPTACPTMTSGKYQYDFGDTAKTTPLLKMETLGSDFVPNPIHAGGLRYHGMAPLVSFLHEQGLIEARAYEQKEIFQAAIKFAHCEGIVPAPESAHAIKAAIDEANKCREDGKEKVIAFNLSGHGFLDLKGYEDYLNNEL